MAQGESPTVMAALVQTGLLDEQPMPYYLKHDEGDRSSNRAFVRQICRVPACAERVSHESLVAPILRCLNSSV